MDSILILQTILLGLTAAVLGAVFWSVWGTVLALRSKVRAHALLTAEADEELRFLKERVERWEQQGMSSKELDQASEVIEKKVARLPDRDRRIIRKGLRQQNRIGAERFLKELLGAASPHNHNVSPHNHNVVSP